MRDAACGGQFLGDVEAERVERDEQQVVRADDRVHVGGRSGSLGVGGGLVVHREGSVIWWSVGVGRGVPVARPVVRPVAPVRAASWAP